MPRFTPPQPEYAAASPNGGSAFGNFSPAQVNGPFRVAYDLYLGDYGRYCANVILQSSPGDLNRLEQYFQIAPPAGTFIDVFLTARTDGASHPTCISTEISVGALTDPKGNPPLVRALMIAELAECFMAARNNGWNCSFSHGEGLSRVMAEEICPGAIPTWLSSAPVWLSSIRTDYIDSTYPSDLQYEPVGCAVLFLYWMRYQLGISWQQIISAGSDTLAHTFTQLTRRNTGYQEFSDIVNLKYPPGTTSQFDNIFPISTAGAAVSSPAFAPSATTANGTAARWVALSSDLQPEKKKLHARFGARTGKSKRSRKASPRKGNSK
jgi:hypothetical protein